MEQTQTETTETEKTSPLFEETAQAIIDKHMQAMMEELKEAGVHALGTVVGVLHETETSTNWCVADDTKDADGNTISAATIVRDIVAGIVGTVGEAEEIGEEV